MKAAFLPDRGVVKIAGDDALAFLNNLITSDIGDLAPGQARFGALLTPQGKIVVDFLVTAEHGGGLLIDCPRDLAQPLATKLGFYKLRAKVTVENLSDKFGVLAVWNGEPATKPEPAFTDPRDAALGARVLVPADQAETTAKLLGAEFVDAAAYEAHRITRGVPRGGTDFAYGDAFPHEANMDRLAGIAFDKGCYIGQEVVSRMQHRGTARTRIVPVTFDGPAPTAGTEIRAADKPIGTLGASAAGRGLALIRTDRALDALDAGAALQAGDITIHLADPEAVRAAAVKTTA